MSCTEHNWPHEKDDCPCCNAREAVEIERRLKRPMSDAINRLADLIEKLKVDEVLSDEGCTHWDRLEPILADLRAHEAARDKGYNQVCDVAANNLARAETAEAVLVSKRIELDALSQELRQAEAKLSALTEDRDKWKEDRNRYANAWLTCVDKVKELSDERAAMEPLRDAFNKWDAQRFGYQLPGEVFSEVFNAVRALLAASPTRQQENSK